MRWITCAALAATAVGLAGCVGSSPPAEPAAIDAADSGPRAMTNELSAYIDEVRAEFESRPGYSGVEIARGNRGVHIWWHGEVPEALRDTLRRAPPGTSASILVAANPRGPLEEARDRIFTEGAQLGVSMAGIESDGSRILVYVWGEALAADPEIPAKIQALTTFPVKVMAGGAEPIPSQH